MRKAKDLTGQKFGRLLVIKRIVTKNKNSLWLCKCECGNETTVIGGNLISGNTKSCGCITKETPNPTTHGKSRTRIYKIWKNMKSRCMNQKVKAYKNYGARCITVHQEWIYCFVNFYNWAINNGYSDNLTLDRIDNNGNYEPSNCRWITYKEQNRNRRNNHLITYQNETHCIAEWANMLNINHETILMRLRRGWTVEKTLTTKIDERNK